MNQKDWVIAIGTHRRWFDVNYWSLIRERIERNSENDKNGKLAPRPGRRSKVKWD